MSQRTPPTVIKENNEGTSGRVHDLKTTQLALPINEGGADTKVSKSFSWKEKTVGGKRRSSGGPTKIGGEDDDGDGERRDPKGPVDGAGGPATGLNRTGKSCRLRWVNYLHPGLKRGRMTRQEERLILELHSRWGNRWSRIAQKLPGRTDNEIKNYWRTHMRKKAQERKRDAISPSSSSSSLAYHSPSPSEPPPEVGLEQRELNMVGACRCMTAGFDEDEDGVKGYPMDQIWDEIATPEAVSGLSFEECKNEVCDTSWPPMPSPMWEYISEPLWKMDDEEFKMLPPVDDLSVSNYQHGREFCN